MSDDVIKVHDLPGIAQYSESIKQFSQSLTTATQDPSILTLNVLAVSCVAVVKD